jgi:transcriptional antiterminator RfaH
MNLITLPRSNTARDSNAPAWFCVRTQLKHEHIAAAHLARITSVDVFFPYIRIRKPTRRGPVWTTEPLFPNYIFSRFDYHTLVEAVRYAPGVRSLVHFGIHTPIIPEKVIHELQMLLSGNEFPLPGGQFELNDRVSIREGAFEGLMATVLFVMPAKQRVKVLLDMLGRSVTVEVDAHSLVPES